MTRNKIIFELIQPNRFNQSNLRFNSINVGMGKRRTKKQRSTKLNLNNKSYEWISNNYQKCFKNFTRKDIEKYVNKIKSNGKHAIFIMACYLNYIENTHFRKTIKRIKTSGFDISDKYYILINTHAFTLKSLYNVDVIIEYTNELLSYENDFSEIDNRNVTILLFKLILRFYMDNNDHMDHVKMLIKQIINMANKNVATAFYQLAELHIFYSQLIYSNNNNNNHSNSNLNRLKLLLISHRLGNECMEVIAGAYSDLCMYEKSLNIHNEIEEHEYLDFKYYSLGLIYYHRSDELEDRNIGVENWKKGAELNSHSCIQNLVTHYLNIFINEKTEKNYQTLLMYINKSKTFQNVDSILAMVTYFYGDYSNLDNLISLAKKNGDRIIYHDLIAFMYKEGKYYDRDLLLCFTNFINGINYINIDGLNVPTNNEHKRMRIETIKYIIKYHYHIVNDDDRIDVIYKYYDLISKYTILKEKITKLIKEKFDPDYVFVDFDDFEELEHKSIDEKIEMTESINQYYDDMMTEYQNLNETIRNNVDDNGWGYIEAEIQYIIDCNADLANCIIDNVPL